MTPLMLVAAGLTGEPLADRANENRARYCAAFTPHMGFMTWSDARLLWRARREELAERRAAYLAHGTRDNTIPLLEETIRTLERDGQDAGGLRAALDAYKLRRGAAGKEK